MDKDLNVWIIKTGDDKFNALSLSTPRFCLVADSEDEARKLAQLALKQFSAGDFKPREHVQRKSWSVSSVLPVRRLKQKELAA